MAGRSTHDRFSRRDLLESTGFEFKKEGARRVFACATPNGYVVMPGGLTRVATGPDARVLPLLALAHAQLGERRQALDVAAQAQAQLAWQCYVVDIADDDQLIERYGTRIPVLRRMDTGAELGWPFDAAQLLTFLNEGPFGEGLSRAAV